MFKVPHYKQTQFLTEAIGNNAFDYDQRCETHPEPTIRVAPLLETPDINTALQKLRIGLVPAFEIAEEGETKSFLGLDNFTVSPNPLNKKSPIFIFDNHNHAFYFWHWTALTHKPSTPLTLIHIDQHKDSRIPAEMLPEKEAQVLKNVHAYTNQILNVGNFIPPAVKTGLIDQVHIIDSSSSLNNPFTNRDFRKKQTDPLHSPYILDIDLDFFAPELDYIEKSQKIALIKKLLPKATVTTIATSPYFMKQELAFQILKEIFIN